MGRGRPGGNPDLEKFQFQSDRPRSCSAQSNLKLEPEILEILRDRCPGWQNAARRFLAQYALDHGGDVPQDLRRFYRLRKPKK